MIIGDTTGEETRIDNWRHSRVGGGTRNDIDTGKGPREGDWGKRGSEGTPEKD